MKKIYGVMTVYYSIIAAENSLCSRPTMSCLAISVIGLGGEVEFENALSAIGCERGPRIRPD